VWKKHANCGNQGTKRVHQIKVTGWPMSSDRPMQAVSYDNPHLIIYMWYVLKQSLKFSILIIEFKSLPLLHKQEVTKK